MENNALVQSWLRALEGERSALPDVPNYWADHPTSLLTTAKVQGEIGLGTGLSIYTDCILPAIESAEIEVILVTCFWARSPTLTVLCKILCKLSAKSQQRRGERIRVRLCFSSSSLFQKLFHPNHPHGKRYPPSQWAKTLGLPSPDKLEGLDLRVKSIFFRPFSVLHPKFVIIDRQVVFLPSCNVSWEDWFEGSIALTGDVVGKFVDFWSHTWANGDVPILLRHAGQPQSVQSVQSIFLPSPHHINPQFSLLPWRSCPPPPRTPLNTFLLAAFARAQANIYVQTPNLTSPPALSALLAALKRGIDVEILTSDRLMILEQLATAGTTTARCVRKLIKLHKRAISAQQLSTADDALLEAGRLTKPGRLILSFYRPNLNAGGTVGTIAAEPVQSHFKLTIVDEEWTILGSGNMDRASWFTSQELGVAFHSQELARNMRIKVESWTKERRSCVYDSG